MTHLTAAGADLAETAFKIGESAVAAGTVISHRVVLGARAFHDPLNADPNEFARMGTEKLTAFTAASQAVLQECQSIQHQVMKYAIDLTADCCRAVWDMATSWSPNQALSAQRRWAGETLARANSHAMRLTTLSAGISGLALAPVHAAVTENARRLSRPSSRE
jgi:hypothetical protein